MIILMAAALLGATATFIVLLLLDSALLVFMVAIPFAGSGSAVLAAAWLYFVRTFFSRNQKGGAETGTRLHRFRQGPKVEVRLADSRNAGSHPQKRSSIWR